MKYALVTGGSRGIGRAICVQIAKDTSYHVLINYNKNKEAALETLAAVKSVGGSGSLLAFDVSDASSVEKALNDFEQQQPEAIIEVLVNNAGLTKDGLFVWMPSEDWHSVIDTSLHGFYHVTRQLLEKMVLNRFGRIVNLVSVSGLKGTAGQANYAAAKAGVIGATKSLAQEVAKRKVTVNAVAPGFIATDMTASINEKDAKKLIPANRFGTAEEVAHLVSFLVSEKASYITGEVININGGLYS
ncbi:3-oxoacyl-ACP reductase FabG [Candidatus Ulvibacter alkanivorans]|uniref:3-oxoacyl-ACP reductase FabG n=1 Tax=Candidatus Ulvibacter alkanivorans TaxID=2267620 RepID=UPI000DF3363C|nr:3-oxoacyl-ACP reductase FabG [Candidatus Ulvibacter alkanivorans]